MKLIKKATTALADKFQVGQEIEVTRNYFDGRGYNTVADKFTIAKVNKVTIDILDAKGDTYRLDPTTVQHIAVVKKPRKSVKRAKSAGAYVEWAKAHEARGGFEENRYGLR